MKNLTVKQILALPLRTVEQRREAYELSRSKQRKLLKRKSRLARNACVLLSKLNEWLIKPPNTSIGFDGRIRGLK